MTEEFPKNELFGLISQFRRAAVSISNCIAEGSGSSSNKDYRNFLDIAVKSALEIASMLFLAERLNYISLQQKLDIYNQTEILIKQIRAFKNSLK